MVVFVPFTLAISWWLVRMAAPWSVGRFLCCRPARRRGDRCRS